MELYVIRHAQSTNNALADERYRVCDPLLTELGERQADVLARHLANGAELQPPASTGDGWDGGGYRITRLYCSPMWRSLQTAYPIGQLLALAPEVWTDIHEKGGIFLDQWDGRGPIGYPGKTRQEIQKAFPHCILPEDITKEGWWNRDHEDWPACHERAARVAQVLREQATSSDQAIAIVSHGGFLDALIKALFSQQPDGQLFYYHYNTAVSRFDLNGNGRLDIHYLNRVGHLPAELVS